MEIYGIAGAHVIKYFRIMMNLSRWYCATLKINPKSEPAKKGLRMMSADDCIPKEWKVD